MRIRIFNESWKMRNFKFYIFTLTISYMPQKKFVELNQNISRMRKLCSGEDRMFGCSLWILHWFFLACMKLLFLGGKLTQEETFSTSINFFILFEVLIKVCRKLTKKKMLMRKVAWRNLYAYCHSVGNVEVQPHLWWEDV